MKKRSLLMKCGMIAAAALLLSACSGLSLNPFSKEKNEDYNALTYGDDYNQAVKKVEGKFDNGKAKVDTETGAARSIASDAKKSFYDTEDPRLDPTDENVRQQVAVARGQAVAAYRKGDRATRSDFLDDAPNDGSLWSNEQDSNYFYSKDKVRSQGDIISVKLEDALVKQMAEEVKKNLSPAEQEVEMALYVRNSAEAKDDKDIKAYRNVASDELKTSEAADVKNRMEKAVRWSQVDLTKVINVTPNEELRAEVVDRYPNGNYRIKAIKRVMYRGTSKFVSLVGVAPAVDFDDKDQIASGKLYDYKLKVVQ